VPGGLSKSQLKDLNNAVEEARSHGLNLPLSEQTMERFATLVEKLDGADKDHSAIYLELKHRNNLV